MNSFSVRSVQTNTNIVPPVHLVIPSMPNSEHSPQGIKKKEKKKYFIDLVPHRMKLHSSLSLTVNQHTGVSSRLWLSAAFDNAVYHDPGLIAS